MRMITLSDTEESVTLALEIEQVLGGHPASAAVYATCWILASIIVQAEASSGVSPVQSVKVVSDQIAALVDHLQAATRGEPLVH